MAALPSTNTKLADNQRGVLKAFQQAAAVQQEAAHALRDSFKKKIRILAPLVYSTSRDAERRLEAATKVADEAKKKEFQLEEERKSREDEKKEASKKLEAATSQYETQRRALTARLAKVKQENEESTKEVIRKLLEERRQETLKERSKMEKQLAAARNEAIKLREELERSVKEVEEGRKERAVLQQKLSDAELRIGKLQQEIESLREGGAKGSLGSQPDPEVSTRITNAVPLNSSSLLDSIAFGESLLTDGRSSLDTTVAQPPQEAPRKAATAGRIQATTASAGAARRAPGGTASRTTATRASTRAQPWATGTARTTRTTRQQQQPPATTKRSSPEPKKRARPRGTSQRQNLPAKFIPEGQSPPRKRPTRSTRAQAVTAIAEATPIARRTRSQRTLVGLRSTVIK
ncbi:hypothetical protein FOL47_002698 [Perkinsus chesapeaki]|uniref:Uncharacterized protein n=1 Tax=Perkinsus chesapeaki TaxID=330153 RepID=A0A7J6MC64_PERCH|nr:hypothetical protein FOL47_002698 [Perkinsus chesapeaki]